MKFPFRPDRQLVEIDQITGCHFSSQAVGSDDDHVAISTPDSAAKGFQGLDHVTAIIAGLWQFVCQSNVYTLVIAFAFA